MKIFTRTRKRTAVAVESRVSKSEPATFDHIISLLAYTPKTPTRSEQPEAFALAY